jgi:hypothetical protein
MGQQLLAMYHSMKFQRMQRDRKPFNRYAPSRTMIFVIHFREPSNCQEGVVASDPGVDPKHYLTFLNSCQPCSHRRERHSRDHLLTQAEYRVTPCLTFTQAGAVHDQGFMLKFHQLDSLN